MQPPDMQRIEHIRDYCAEILYGAFQLKNSGLFN